MPKMRSIVLKSVPCEGSTLDYRNMLLTISKTPGGSGVDGVGMAIWLPIQMAIASAQAKNDALPEVLLTEEQFTKLTEAITTFKGYIVCPENGQFIEDIKNSPSVEVDKV